MFVHTFEMAQLQSGSRPWPILGPNDEDWASFAYLWPNYVRIDHRNINNGTGSAAGKEKVRKANLHSILALATQNSAQAREIIEERRSSEADEDDRDGEPDLDGEADFTALCEHFNPRLQVFVTRHCQSLKSHFRRVGVATVRSSTRVLSDCLVRCANAPNFAASQKRNS